MTGGDIPDRVRALKQRIVVSAVAGRVVKLVKRGREHVGLCPFHREATGSFTVNDEKDFYHCFGCGSHGDAIRFMMEYEGKSFIDALRALEGDSGLAEQSATVRASVKATPWRGGRIEGIKAAAMLWGETRPARGSIVENWFGARGLDPAASGALDVIRFHPRCPTHLWREWQKPRDVDSIAPAMVAPILRISGGPGARALHLRGVHVTFLSGDGRAKAYLEPWADRETGELKERARRVMWGKMAGGAVLMPGAPLAAGADITGALVALLDAPGLCVVGEGLESSLSFAARHSGVRLACATLALGNLEGTALRVGKRAAEPLWRVAGDPGGSRPFVFERAGRVAIGVDADMKPTEAKWVQERKGAFPVQRPLSGMERADRCAALACWWWRDAGAERVNAGRPPAGLDFNDMDQGGHR